MEEMGIYNTLFPEETLLPTLVTPDFPYIHKELLNKWYKGLIEKGELYEHYVKPQKYSTEAIEYAINYYLQNGRNITKIVRNIGYPCKSVLSQWITEKFPNEPAPLLKGKVRIS